MGNDNKKAAKSAQALKRVGHCLYRSEDSRIYYAILKRGGKQIKRSLRTDDHSLAKRRLADLQEKAKRLNTSEGAKITFQEFGDRWVKVAGVSLKESSRVRQDGIVKGLSKFFGALPVRRITRAHVETWAEQRSREVSARSFNYERQTLNRLLDSAVREGLMLENPARDIKRLRVRRERPLIPTKGQFRELLSEIRKLKSTALDAADLCEFLGYSGCRLSEATSMLWRDVDFEAKLFTVTGGERGTKNYEERTVPLFPPLERLLLSLRARQDRSCEAGDRILAIESGKNAMTAACKNGGLPHFTHHHLRHFFCSNAIEAGVDFKTIASWLGHKDGGVLVARTYGHLRDEHSAAMAKRMTFDLEA